ncbi:hypothetical protein [Paenibacillus sp. 32352]|uniref:hypothetical protein n=1 Tax=Paenibacillus sp. 32352 TaxID=1969111 RepID=UPI0009AD5467|nr:hypothetical protein [Paenibacillus sp. 32352]
MKLFTKEIKNIEVEGRLFHCIIDQTPQLEAVIFKIYPASTKTSYCQMSFSWTAAWSVTFHKPSVCASLIRYALGSGWDPSLEKNRWEIPDADFLIHKLQLDNLEG